MKAESNVEETIEYGPLKETDAPSYNIQEIPLVRVFFGEKLEIFLYIPERSVPKIKADEAVPETLTAWLDKAQFGGMSRLLRVQLGTRNDVEVLMPLIKAVIRH